MELDAESLSPPTSLEELVFRAVASLELASGERPAELLAEEAVWLALTNLGLPIAPDLWALANGKFWARFFPLARPEASGAAEGEPRSLRRAACGLLLLEHARKPESGAAERAASVLACVSLGCADPETGVALQRSLGGLGLLDIVEQIPVAEPIRDLALEFRHLDLGVSGGEKGAPATFVARVEDLLERLDRERLMALDLKALPTAARDAEEARLQALLRTRSPHLISLARVLFQEPEPIPDSALLLDACLEDRPQLWGRLARAEALRLLDSAYTRLRERLGGTAYALVSRRAGYGLLAGGALEAAELPPMPDLTALPRSSLFRPEDDLDYDEESQASGAGELAAQPEYPNWEAWRAEIEPELATPEEEVEEFQDRDGWSEPEGDPFEG